MRAFLFLKVVCLLSGFFCSVTRCKSCAKSVRRFMSLAEQTIVDRKTFSSIRHANLLTFLFSGNCVDFLPYTANFLAMHRMEMGGYFCANMKRTNKTMKNEPIFDCKILCSIVLFHAGRPLVFLNHSIICSIVTFNWKVHVGITVYEVL